MVSDRELEKKSLLARVTQHKEVNAKPVSAAKGATIEETHAVWGSKS